MKTRIALSLAAIAISTMSFSQGGGIDNVGTVASGSNNFGLTFLAQVSDGTKNVMISPISLTYALAMATNGGVGKTQMEMRQVMNLSSIDMTRMNSGFRELMDTLANDDDEVDMLVANGVWTNQSIPISKSFMEVVEGQYRATARSVNMADPATAPRINSWVARQTNNRIKNLVSSTTRDALMMIINAVSFKADWSRPFSRDATGPGTFTTQGGQSRTVPMMRQTSHFSYGEYNGAQVVTLPYGKGAFAMTVVLPKAGHNVHAMLESFDSHAWDNMISATQGQRVTLTMPKWTGENSIAAKPYLQRMGMEMPFERGKADFSGISNVPSYITSVTHKTFVKVDEKGTEAAAATAIEVGTTSAPVDPPKVMNLNRPFLYAITNVRTGAILFLGIVADPSR